MSGPTFPIPRVPAPSPADGARSGSLLFLCESLAYLFWIAVDTAVGPTLSDLPDFAFSSPVAGAAMAAVVLSRHRYAVHRVAVVALALSAVISLVSFVYDGAIEVSLAELFALAVVTVAAVRQASGGTAVAFSAAAFAVILSDPALRFTDSEIDRPMTIVAAGLGWASTVAVAAVLREVRVRRAASLAQARSSERLELARELHDVVAHHVTGIVVAAQAAVTVARTRPEEAGPALESIERAGAEALAGMRRMVGVLRGGEEASRSVAAEPSDVDSLVDRFDPGRTRTVLDRDPALGELPAGVGATAYRVVQEALTNVHRHAPDATSVHVGLHVREGTFEVTVRNEGGTHDRRSPGRGGFGLAGMAERVGALGGTLQVGPDGPASWVVRAALPLGAVR